VPGIGSATIVLDPLCLDQLHLEFLLEPVSDAGEYSTLNLGLREARDRITDTMGSETICALYAQFIPACAHITELNRLLLGNLVNYPPTQLFVFERAISPECKDILVQHIPWLTRRRI
jgi:hypothetical protein